MDAPPDTWPNFLSFVRDWIFIPAGGVITWLWFEIRSVKDDQREQLDRIESSVGKMTEAMKEHQIDDLKRFASKDDLQILRNDVVALRQHIDDRLDRLGDQLAKLGNGGGLRR